ncbi:hypothetical protein [Rhizomonospora bruguierae]|uniref:hypothetical protein n=1 Tax=Rhizomonospora bruguierae TaxID=1581705 RepID=UPI001BCC079E|nr:hypothetical protein [Micromonospora sp. NBRC 107566]
MDLHLEVDSDQGRRAGLERALRGSIRAGRLALAGYLGRARGVLATPDRIVITSGYVQALALLVGVLAEAAPGEAVVAMEDPGLAFHREVVRRHGGRVAATGGRPRCPATAPRRTVAIPRRWTRSPARSARSAAKRPAAVPPAVAAPAAVAACRPLPPAGQPFRRASSGSGSPSQPRAP